MGNSNSNSAVQDPCLATTDLVRNPRGKNKIVDTMYIFSIDLSKRLINISFCFLEGGGAIKEKQYRCWSAANLNTSLRMLRGS